MYHTSEPLATRLDARINRLLRYPTPAYPSAEINFPAHLRIQTSSIPRSALLFKPSKSGPVRIWFDAGVAFKIGHLQGSFSDNHVPARIQQPGLVREQGKARLVCDLIVEISHSKTHGSMDTVKKRASNLTESQDLWFSRCGGGPQCFRSFGSAPRSLTSIFMKCACVKAEGARSRKTLLRDWDRSNDTFSSKGDVYAFINCMRFASGVLAGTTRSNFPNLLFAGHSSAFHRCVVAFFVSTASRLHE